MDDEDCCQPGCKLSERDWTSEASSAAARHAEVLHEVLPTGIDREGKEVSFEVYLLSRFPDDTTARTKMMENTYNSRYRDSREFAREYVDWYYDKMPGETKRTKNGYCVYEHVAGPNCVHPRGYKGHAISAEEMKHCNTMQFIVPYGNEFHQSNPSPESDDEDFEREGIYHLTGLGEGCGSWEDDCSVYPARHGCDEVNPFEDGVFDQGDPPFHPHCLEIYRRVSELRRGTTDMAGLAHWIPTSEVWQKPEHPAVERGADQWWCHRTGDEFLAANPLHIPGFSLLLDAAKRPRGTFDAKTSPFSAGSTTSENFGDLFGRLPVELRDMIVASLGSKDIASLRLASRSFRHPPYTMWHDLMKKEMPWIWEAWSDRSYPLMACVTKRELVEHDETIKTRSEALAKDRTVDSEQRAVREQLIVHDDAEFRKSRPVQQLDRLHTDWYYLYCQLRREWKNIKGLQNRERIWKVIEFVSRRIANPNESIDFAKQEHVKAFPYTDLNPEESDDISVGDSDDLSTGPQDSAAAHNTGVMDQ